MRKRKRIIAWMLALAMAFPVPSNAEALFSDEESLRDEILVDEEDVTGIFEDAEDVTLPDADQEEMQDFAWEEEFQELPDTETEDFSDWVLPETEDDAEADLFLDEMDDSLIEDEEPEEVFDENSQEMASSLLPVEEKKAVLLLMGKSETELKKIPVSYILNNLQDTEGNYINIRGKKILWTYYKDDFGKTVTDEYHEIPSSGTVDMSVFKDNLAGYKMELLVGDGHQLSTENVRYIVNVYFSDTMSEFNSLELYTQDPQGRRRKVQASRTKEAGEGTLLYVPQHTEGTEYYLGITSLMDEHPAFNVEVYTEEEFEKRLADTKNGWKNAVSISDVIINPNMKEPGAGYYGTFDPQDHPTFVLVVEYAESHSICIVRRHSVIVQADQTWIDASLSKNVNGKLVSAVEDQGEAADWSLCAIREDADGVEGQTLLLDPAYDGAGEYFLTLDAYHETYGEDAPSHVKAAYAGIFESAKSAAQSGAADIKDQLFPAATAAGNQGYPISYEELFSWQPFTIFFEDDTRYQLKVIAESTATPHNYTKWEEYYTQTVVGEQDPWFRVTGVMLGDRLLDAYIVENNDSRSLDTYYGKGFQSIFVNEYLTPAQLRSLKLLFWTADEDKIRIRTNTGQNEKSGESVHDFTSPVEYHALFEGRQKNYTVDIIPKRSGPHLYVFGSGAEGEKQSREVLLDEYYEYRHDILIANLGDKKLEGLSASLEDAVHVKLDDFWTLGGDGNSTLEPFTATYSTAEYGELMNLAKIRILPDGKGEISGRLVISANGQEDVVINLYGSALQPIITTQELDPAVKYVPYSAVIATSNHNDWLDVTFHLQGKLPPGMTFDSKTGELYGVPSKTGSYRFSVTADYDSEDFESSEKEFSLTVQDNDNETVFLTSDENYEIVPEENGESGYLGERVSDYDFELELSGEDELFISNGNMEEFEKLWLNGVELVKGKDYEVEAGSTRITIFSQTLRDRTNTGGDGRNTVAAEFRIRTGQTGSQNLGSTHTGSTNTGGGNGGNTASQSQGGNVAVMRRTSQNFRIRQGSSSSSGDHKTDPVNPGNSSQNQSDGKPDNISGSQGGSGGRPDSSSQNQSTGTGTSTSGSQTGSGSRPGNSSQNVSGGSQTGNASSQNASGGSGGTTSSGTGSQSSGSGSGSSGSVGGNNSGGSNPAPVVPTTIRLSKTSVTMYKGKSITLKAVTNKSIKVTWSSSNSRIASVKNGKVTAKKKGTVKITAKTADGKRAVCKVIVQLPVKKVTLNKTKLSMYVGKTAKLKATVTPAGASKKNLTWSSSNKKVAVVSNGKITAKKKGTAVIRVKTPGGKSATCKVTVLIPVKKIKLSKKKITLTEGKSYTLKATVKPTGASKKNLVWSSSKKSVAVVKNGKVTAVKKGKCVITVKSPNGKKAKCTVVVKAAAKKPSVTPQTGDGSSVQTQGGSTTPSQTQGGSTTPSQTQGGSTTPGQTQGGNTTPGQTQGGNTTPGQSQEGKPVSGQKDENDPAPASEDTQVKDETDNTDDTDTLVETDSDQGEEDSSQTVRLSRLILRLEVGEQEEVLADVLPEGDIPDNLTWTSSNSRVATVENGIITAVRSGYATIMARTGRDLVATCSVLVVEPQVEAESITLSETSIRLNPLLNDLKVAVISAEIYPENATDQTVVWKSENEDVAVVRDGVIGAKGEGTTTITATLGNGLSASCEVIVEAGPREVRTAEDLKKVAEDLQGNYILMNNIDLGDENWVPLGSHSESAFGGTFDGNGYTISGLYIESCTDYYLGTYVGLFGYCTGTIKNLTVIGRISVDSASLALSVGGICGRLYGSYGGTITNCTSGVSVEGFDGREDSCNCKAGGIVGSVSGGVISGCSNYGSVVAAAMAAVDSYAYAGGITGELNTGLISDCRNYGAVDAFVGTIAEDTYIDSVAGGIVSVLYSGTLKDNTNSGRLRADIAPDTAETNSGLVVAGGIYALGRGGTLSGNTCLTSDISAFGNSSVRAFTGTEAGFVYASGIRISSSSFTMNLGESKALTAEILPANASWQEVTWKSSDSTVAMVENGVITAIRTGKATITASPRYGWGAEATCSVTVKDPNSTEVEVEKVTVSRVSWDTYGIMGIDQTKQCKATLQPEAAANQPVTWISSDPSVISVDQDGNVTAHQAGKVTITARADNGVEGKVTIEAVEAFVELLDGGSYQAVQGTPLDVSVRIYLDREPVAGEKNYILYLAYLNNGWEEIASFDIDGDELFEERYTGKAHIKSMQVNGKIVDAVIEVDTAKLPLMSNKLFTVSTFPYNNFGTGGSIHDRTTNIFIL